MACSSTQQVSEPRLIKAQLYCRQLLMLCRAHRAAPESVRQEIGSRKKQRATAIEARYRDSQRNRRLAISRDSPVKRYSDGCRRDHLDSRTAQYWAMRHIIQRFRGFIAATAIYRHGALRLINVEHLDRRIVRPEFQPLEQQGVQPLIKRR